MHGRVKSFLTCLAPSRKLFFKYLRSPLTPSSNAPFLVRLFVLVKSDFNAPEPPYAFAIASAWSAHTTHGHRKHINQQRKHGSHTLSKVLAQVFETIDVIALGENSQISKLCVKGIFCHSSLNNVCPVKVIHAVSAIDSVL